MKFGIYLGLVVLCLFGCKKKQSTESETFIGQSQSSSGTSASRKNIWLSPELEKSGLLHDSLLEAFGHSYPVRIFRDTAGIVWLNGWEDLVAFNIDEESGDKFFEYLLPLDTAIRNMTGGNSGLYRYFSMNDFFKKSGKKFIINEVNHRNASSGVVFEHNNINLYFAGNRKERNVVLTQASITDAFEKDIEITSILYNLSDKPISEFNGTITISETTGLKDTTIVQKVTLGPVNLLTREIPPYSVQMVKKKVPNKVKPRETRFRYFTDHWQSISYKFSGDTTTYYLKD